MRTTNIRLALISTIAAVSMSALPAVAEDGQTRREHPHDPAAFIKRFDKNGDGKLQITELPDRLQQRLGPGDTNKDGVLSIDELTARWAALRAERKAKEDTNGDGLTSAPRTPTTAAP